MDTGLLDLEPMDAEPSAPPTRAEGSETVDDDPAGDADQTKREQAGYTSSAERCSTCEYYTSEDMRCGKFNFDAEPEGHCQSWEAPSGGAGETPEGQEPRFDDDDTFGGEDDLDPLG